MLESSSLCRIMGKITERSKVFTAKSADHDGISMTMTIRIFNGREVRIENSVTRVTVRHHEAC